MAEGQHTISIFVQDDVGNESVAIRRTLSIDTTAPAAPSISSLVNNSTITDTLPTLVGASESQSSILILNSIGNIVCQTEATNRGSWVCTLTSPLSGGENKLRAVAVDKAGNQSLETLHFIQLILKRGLSHGIC